MFSKSKINDPAPKPDSAAKPAAPAEPRKDTSEKPGGGEFKAAAPKAKPPASVLSPDLHVTGNLKTTGDVQVEGTVEGDIRAHLLTIGESATIKGEIIADDVVINGRIVGRRDAFDSECLVECSAFVEHLSVVAFLLHDVADEVCFVF